MEENENFIHNKYGYCYYVINSNKTALIFNLYIEPNYRKQGHAKHLIQLVINEIKKTDNKQIQIKAEPQENSISMENIIYFYKNMGLEII